MVEIYNWYLTGYWKVMWIGSIILCGWGIGKLCWWKVSKVVIEMLKRIVIIAWHWDYVPSRDDNRLIGQSTVICTGRQIGDCDHWSTDWRLWPAVFWLETGTAPFLIGDRLGFPSHGVTREGNCPLTFERGTVSTHLEYIYIELECSASGMAWVEHQGLYMRVSREMGFEKGMNENFSKESMNWGLDGEVWLMWKLIEGFQVIFEK